MTGHEYEYRCAKRLKRCGFSGVTVTKGSGDQGIDIIAHRRGAKYGIQCKYYSRPVGNSAVQEAYAGAKYHGCDFAAVMTNSTFTRSATELAESTGVILWENDTLPFLSTRFRITKWMGALVFALSACALFVLNITNMDVSWPVLQNAFLVSMLLGGLCNFFEGGFFCVDAAACLFYLLAAVLMLIEAVLSNRSVGRADLWLLIPFLISLLRGGRLYRLHRIGNRDIEDEEEELQDIL